MKLVGKVATLTKEVLHLLNQLDSKKIYKLVIEEENEKERSLSANAYYWHLVGEIGKITGESNIDIHKREMFEHTPFDLMIIDNKVDMDAYFKYYDVITEYPKSKEYRIYRSSKKLSSKEFNRLIRGTEDDAANLGIPTLDTEYVDKLIDKWEKDRWQSQS